MKFPTKFIIALCALIVAISAIIVCVMPYYGPEKVVYKYIKAASSGNVEKMLDCTVASEVSNTLGASGLSGVLAQNSHAAEPNALIRNLFSIPTDATEVISVKVLGCSKENSVDLSGLGYEVTALIKTVYIDAEGENHDLVLEEDFSVINTGKGYKIYG